AGVDPAIPAYVKTNG
nr:RecName: Full=33 kDa cell wall protein [Phaseolus vulgaris]